MSDNDGYVIGWPDTVFAFHREYAGLVSAVPLTFDDAKKERDRLYQGLGRPPVIYKLVKVETGGS